METDMRGEGSTELRELMSKFIPICIRDYVAEVRKTDWRKCCPFNLSGDPEADEVLARLILEDDAADNTINGGSTEGATRRVEEARLPNERGINEDAIVAVNDRPQDSVNDDNAAETVNTPSESAACQNEKRFANDAIAADGANAMNDAVTGHDVVSNNAKDAAQSQSENIISDEDVIPSGNGDGANAMNDGPSESSDFELRDARAPGEDNRRRNLARRKPQKFRRLSEIYKQLGSCIYKNEDNFETAFTAETTHEDDSDEVPLGTFVRERRSIRRNSKRIELLNKKRKAPENNSGSDSELGSRYYLRTKRIMHEHKSKESSSEDSLSSRGRKRSRETVEEDCAREVLKLLDGNQRRPTEEGNHSGPSRGVKRAQPPVQPLIDISINNVETASGCVQKRIRESSPPTDDESMAIMQLLRLSKACVNTTKTSVQTTTDDESGLDGVVPPASGSKPAVEVNVVDGAGLVHAAQTKSKTYICRISRNPAEFPTPNAKKFMRRGKVVKTV